MGRGQFLEKGDYRGLADSSKGEGRDILWLSVYKTQILTRTLLDISDEDPTEVDFNAKRNLLS